MCCDVKVRKMHYKRKPMSESTIRFFFVFVKNVIGQILTNNMEPKCYVLLSKEKQETNKYDEFARFILDTSYSLNSNAFDIPQNVENILDFDPGFEELKIHLSDTYSNYLLGNSQLTYELRIVETMFKNITGEFIAYIDTQEITDENDQLLTFIFDLFDRNLSGNTGILKLITVDENNVEICVEFMKYKLSVEVYNVAKYFMAVYIPRMYFVSFSDISFLNLDELSLLYHYFINEGLKNKMFK